MPLRSISPYESLTETLGGGLNNVDAPHLLGEGEVRELINLSFPGVGRIAPRRAATYVAEYRNATNQGTLVGIVMFPHGEYTNFNGALDYIGVLYLVHENFGTNNGVIGIYAGNGSGRLGVRIGELTPWGTFPTPPKLSTAVINRKLFIVDDAGQKGIVVFDPFYPTSTGTEKRVYQPVFKFTGESANNPYKNKSRVLSEYNNMLFSAGYGTELEPVRPEMVRFSYLGLFNDGQGRGDAGYAATPGAPTATERQQNFNLFDYDDYFMVGERGTPVVNMVPAMGRLVIATPYSAYSLFGYERSSFQVELLDNTRGSTSTKGMVQAEGLVYWWSPAGPVRWEGGNTVREIGRKVLGFRNIVEQSNRVVAAHSKETKEVRWYVDNYGVAYNYERDQWSKISLPSNMKVLVSGRVSPFTTSNTGEAAPLAGPAGPAANFTATDITHNSAKTSWNAGDTSPGTQTLVYRRDDPAGVWVLVATLDAITQSLNHSNLTASKTYYIEIIHEKNGKRSTALAGSFATLATPPATPTTLAAPTGLVATDYPIQYEAGGPFFPSVLLDWKMGQTGVSTEIWRNNALLHTVGVDVTSYHDKAVEAGLTYSYYVRHTNGSIFSAASNTVSIVPTTGGGGGGGTEVIAAA